VAAWLAYVRGKNDAGATWVVDDPLAARLAACHRGGPGDTIGALLALADVIPQRLSAHPGFRREVLAAYTALLAAGGRG
jgi:fructuronate reductase